MNKQTPSDEEALAIVCKHYGVQPTGDVKTDLQALAKRPEWGPAFAKTQDALMALEELAIVETDGWLDAWFAAHDVLAWDPNARGENKGAVVRKPGCRVFASDGRLYDLAGTEVPKDAKRGVPCRIGPAHIRRDLIRDSMSVSFPGGKTLKFEQHGSKMPLTSFGKKLKEINEPVGENKLLPNDTGDFPVLVSATVTENDDDISYFPPGGKFGESLSVTVFDSEGEELKVNLDPAKMMEYGIRPGADREEIKETLKGEPYFGMGKIGQTYGIEVGQLEHQGAKGQEVLDNLITYLEGKGCIRRGANDYGPTVNLTFMNGDGSTKFVPVGKHRIAGIAIYNTPDGQTRTKLTALSKQPSFRTKRSESKFVDDDGMEQVRVNNPDGFSIFPNLAGSGQSRFAGLASKVSSLNDFLAPSQTA